jgi:hypothetical protein
MLAYLTALQLGKGLLVYAAGEQIPHDITIPEADKRILVRAIDVARTPADVLTQVRNLADGIRLIAAQARDGLQVYQKSSPCQCSGTVFVERLRNGRGTVCLLLERCRTRRSTSKDAERDHGTHKRGAGRRWPAAACPA